MTKVIFNLDEDMLEQPLGLDSSSVRQSLGVFQQLVSTLGDASLFLNNYFQHFTTTP